MPRKPQGGEKQPLVSVASALAEAQGDGTQGQVRVQPGSINATGCTLDVEFGEPKLSKQGKSYLVTYGSVKQGAMKIVVTAYIPLGKDKGRRDGRVDDGPQDRERDSARQFYGERR